MGGMSNRFMRPNVHRLKRDSDCRRLEWLRCNQAGVICGRYFGVVSRRERQWHLGWLWGRYLFTVLWRVDRLAGCRTMEKKGRGPDCDLQTSRQSMAARH